MFFSVEKEREAGQRKSEQGLTKCPQDCIIIRDIYVYVLSLYIIYINESIAHVEIAGSLLSCPRDRRGKV